MSSPGAIPVDLRDPVTQARIAGQTDGAAGRPMDRSYVDAPDVGKAALEKQAYTKSYVAAREARGAARRRKRTQKRKGGKARKTRGRK